MRADSLVDYIRKAEECGGIEPLSPVAIEFLSDPDAKVCGMNFKTILQLRLEYLLRGGKTPITVESVKETFKDKQ